MKINYITLEIKSWDDAFYLRKSILEQIKFYGGCARSFKNSHLFNEAQRNEEFLDCVNKVKMFVGYYKKISKMMEKIYEKETFNH